MSDLQSFVEDPVAYLESLEVPAETNVLGDDRGMRAIGLIAECRVLWSDRAVRALQRAGPARDRD